MRLLGKRASETLMFLLTYLILALQKVLIVTSLLKSKQTNKKQTHVLVVPIYLDKSEAVHQMKSNIVLSTLAVATK